MIKTIGNASRLQDWIEADTVLFNQPIPKGWITVMDYARAMQPPLAKKSAWVRLKKMVEAGIANCAWHHGGGQGGRFMIYQLVAKKKK